MGNLAMGQSANPKGAILAQVEAVKAVLTQIAKLDPTMAPFADQAAQSLDNGVSAITTQPSATPEGTAPASSPPITPARPVGGSIPGGSIPAMG